MVNMALTIGFKFQRTESALVTIRQGLHCVVTDRKGLIFGYRQTKSTLCAHIFTESTQFGHSNGESTLLCHRQTKYTVFGQSKTVSKHICHS